jgi:hypothetical protein
MRHRLVLVLMLLWGAATAHAQISIRVTVRNPAPRQLSAWQTDPGVVSIEITNQGAALASVRLSGEIRAEDGRVVASTDDNDRSIPRFALPGNGRTTRLRGRDVLSTSAVRVDRLISKMAAQTNSLPEGEYTFCVRLLTDEGKQVSDADEACGEVQIIIASPPQLVLPAEGQIVNNANVQFQWTPVPRGIVSGNVEYDIVVVPILGREQPEVAIKRNEKLLNRRERRYGYQMSSADRPLTVNGARRFAWQVRAVTSDGLPCTSNEGYSEVGTFRFDDNVTDVDTVRKSMPDTIVIRDTRIAVTSWGPKASDGTYSGKGCMVIACDRRTNKPMSIPEYEKSLTRRKGYSARTFTVRETVEDTATEVSVQQVNPLGGTYKPGDVVKLPVPTQRGGGTPYNTGAVARAILAAANQSKNCFEVQLSGIVWEGPTSRSVVAKGNVTFIASDDAYSVPVLYPADSFVVEVEKLTLTDSAGFSFAGHFYHTSALIEDGTGELARIPLSWKSSTNDYCLIEGWQQPDSTLMWIGETGIAFYVDDAFNVDFTNASKPMVAFQRIRTPGVPDRVIRSNIGIIHQELFSVNCKLARSGIFMTASGVQNVPKRQLTTTPRGHSIQYGTIRVNIEYNKFKGASTVVAVAPDSLHEWLTANGASAWYSDFYQTSIDSLYTLTALGLPNAQSDIFYVSSGHEVGRPVFLFRTPNPDDKSVAARYTATASYPTDHLQFGNDRNLRRIMESQDLTGMLLYGSARPLIETRTTRDAIGMVFTPNQFHSGFVYLGPGGLTSTSQISAYDQNNVANVIYTGRIGSALSRSRNRFTGQLPVRSSNSKNQTPNHYFSIKHDVADSIHITTRIKLPDPLGMQFDVPDVSITSIGEFPSSPVTMDSSGKMNNPWRLEFVPRELTQPDMGYVSFDRGVINLTQSGIREKIHFEKPFYIHLAEYLADGVPGSFIVDYNSSGQKFDGLPYLPNVVRLSPLPPSNNVLEYMQTSGHVSVPFFGVKYMNIFDARDTILTRPRLNRYVWVQRESPWSSKRSDLNWDKQASIGRFEFDMKYNVDGQDGFVGLGLVQTPQLSDLTSTTLTVNRYGTCFHSEGLDVDLTNLLQTAAFVTAIDKSWACGCVENDAFSSIALGGQGADGLSATSLLASVAGGNEVTLGIHHDLITLWQSGAVQLSTTLNATDARILLRTIQDRRTGSMRGTVNLDFNSASAVGGFTVAAELDVFSGKDRESQVRMSYFQGKAKVTTDLSSWLSGSNTKTEGGMFLGINVPKTRAWVLYATDSRFKLRDEFLADKISGSYYYGMFSAGVETMMCRGRADMFAGVGNLNDNGVATLGVDVHGSLFDIVYGSALANLQGAIGQQRGFYGRATFTGCYNTFFWGRGCADFDIGVGLTRSRGFYVE